MTEPKKDTIYIDVDDEITAIVEKVNKSSSKIIALVLPKRAVVLQSIVNMKLLKRAADDGSKRVVLITSEAGLLSLAGAVGMYVAKNLQSKPEIPAAPDGPEELDELLETEEAAASDDGDVDKDATVGELSDDDDDLFESPGEAAAPAAVAGAKAKSKAAKASKASKAKKDKKSRVPNFDKFRTKTFIGIGIVLLLIVAWYLAFVVAPRATVTITTETSTVNSTINFTASTSAQTIDAEQNIIPAKEIESQKTETQKVPATGQKDLGTKATGSVSLSAPCGPTVPQVPAGSGVSTGGLTFITATSVALTPTIQGGSCRFVGNVGVTAQANGDQYNIAAGRSFTVAGSNSVTGNNPAAMSGGSSKIAKVVSQQDVDTAKQKITDASTTVKDELKKQLEDEGYYALVDTFATKNETITPSPGVDQEATEVTVTAVRVYAMAGVKRDDLKTLVNNDVQDEVESRKQQVQNDGIDSAVFRLGEKKSEGNIPISMQVQVVLGPKIDNDQLKKDIAGKKKGDVENIIKGIDGVTDVSVDYSPFWVSMTPKSTNKITLEYKEAQE